MWCVLHGPWAVVLAAELFVVQVTLHDPQVVVQPLRPAPLQMRGVLRVPEAEATQSEEPLSCGHGREDDGIAVHPGTVGSANRDRHHLSIRKNADSHLLNRVVGELRFTRGLENDVEDRQCGSIGDNGDAGAGHLALDSDPIAEPLWVRAHRGEVRRVHTDGRHALVGVVAGIRATAGAAWMRRRTSRSSSAGEGKTSPSNSAQTRAAARSSPAVASSTA